MVPSIRPAPGDEWPACIPTEEILRLALLRQAIQAGHGIGNIAQLPIDQLTVITVDSKQPAGPAERVEVSSQGVIEEALKAIKALNTAGFEETLSKGIVALGNHGLLEKVIGPLAAKLGDLWRQGHILAAHKHFAQHGYPELSGPGFEPVRPQ